MKLEDMSLTPIRYIKGSPPLGIFKRDDGREFAIPMLIGPSGWKPSTKHLLDALLDRR